MLRIKERVGEGVKGGGKWKNFLRRKEKGNRLPLSSPLFFCHFATGNYVYGRTFRNGLGGRGAERGRGTTFANFAFLWRRARVCLVASASAAAAACVSLPPSLRWDVKEPATDGFCNCQGQSRKKCLSLNAFSGREERT